MARSPKRKLPKLPDNAPTTNRYKYKPRFGLIIETDDECGQSRLYKKLTGMGMMPKVVSI